MTAISINGDRLWASLMSLAEIGGTPAGGVARLALTDLDRQGRERVIGWAKEAGCTIRVDQIGNIFARRAGRENDAPRSRRAATSTRSRPAASSTATTACWPCSKSSAR